MEEAWLWRTQKETSWTERRVAELDGRSLAVEDADRVELDGEACSRLAWRPVYSFHHSSEYHPLDFQSSPAGAQENGLTGMLRIGKEISGFPDGIKQHCSRLFSTYLS